MPLLELPLITAVTSTGTFVVLLWIGWSLHRHIYYDPDYVRLSQRLRHPRCSPEQLAEKAKRERERRRG